MNDSRSHPIFADRISRLQASPIRDILNAIDQPGMVSFAGGLPADSSFPEMPLRSVPNAQLQYGASEGDAELRQHVADDLSARGLEVSADRILILSGSQQGIDLVGKLLVQPGTEVAVESPTYLAALQVFTCFGARYQTFTPHTLQSLKAMSPSLVYTIPSFQNPSAHVYSRAQRELLASSCEANGAVLFEDDPYRELRYEPIDDTPVCSLMTKGEWVYQSSWSKTLAPGLRLGYLACSSRLYPYLLRLKQAADLHSNRLSQWLVLKQLQSNDASHRRDQLVALYRSRRDEFDDLLQAHVHDAATWNRPAGGLFFWLTLNRRTPLDTRTLLPAALEQGVAFMPGEPFYADGRTRASALRLNFSHADAESARRGLATLGQLLRATPD